MTNLTPEQLAEKMEYRAKVHRVYPSDVTDLLEAGAATIRHQSEVIAWRTLQARCEAANGPDRALDWDILQAAGQQAMQDGHTLRCDFTGSLDAIVALSEKTMPNAGISLDKYWWTTPHDVVWGASIVVGETGDTYIGMCRPTPALTLCAAYCNVRAALEETK